MPSVVTIIPELKLLSRDNRRCLFWNLAGQCSVRAGPLQCRAGAVQWKDARDIFSF